MNEWYFRRDSYLFYERTFGPEESWLVRTDDGVFFHAGMNVKNQRDFSIGFTNWIMI